MKSEAVSVGTTATLLVAGDNQNRTCYFHSTSGSTYLGNSTVTTSSGLHLPNNATITITLPFGESIYGITNTGTTDVRVLTPDAD
ncbi:hypothetical protein UFOVP1566_18 [uncultured Caudovirales phage]|uniref:Uncharacterized protein n=1 Tax=uncultured Caudovirales phage TaxID=2100421 RepID=A0A6J5S6Z8_9CAUD|nr:hypothetical protein UFOVP1389_36 [uncultured Caudovirales phage]CAB5229761.1 hypothetical protein UFOVP1566_18 [uncultured Caudovirales phage]